MGCAILLPETAPSLIQELFSAKPREIGALEGFKNLRMLLLASLTSSGRGKPCNSWKHAMRKRQKSSFCLSLTRHNLLFFRRKRTPGITKEPKPDEARAFRRSRAFFLSEPVKEIATSKRNVIIVVSRLYET